MQKFKLLQVAQLREQDEHNPLESIKNLGKHEVQVLVRLHLLQLAGH